MRSIIQSEKKCFVCHMTMNLHDHHIFFASNRKHSERYGLKVWLCGYHHNLSDYGVHFNKTLDTKLKQIAQSKFEEKYSHDDFMKIFGKNYL